MNIIKKLSLALVLFGLVFIPPAMANTNNNIKAAALKAHNIVRAKHKQRPLIWSNDLTQISQQWANRLAKGCKMYHHQGNIPFGENLFIYGAATNVNHAVKAWAAEEKHYNYKQGRCAAGKVCGHYTQIVWKGTTDVGCGMQSCGNGSQIYVCAYFPAGNIVGARPY